MSGSRFWVCACVLLLSGVPVFGGAITSTWTDANGNWSLAGNWDNGVPNNGGGNTYSAVINNGSSVHLDISATINNLTIASSNSLAGNNGLVFTLNSGTGAGSILDNGTITLNSTGSNTDLQLIGGGTVTLGGTGTLTMGNNANNRIYGSGATTFVIGATSLVQGAGQIGVSQTAITNNGTITANQSAGMTISPSAGGFTNTNLVQANCGAVLTLNGVTTNSWGTIQAVGGGSIVKLSGATIAGGTLGSSGGGLVEDVSSSTLNGITNLGTIQTDNGIVTSLQGTITNSGLITLNSSGSNTDLAADRRRNGHAGRQRHPDDGQQRQQSDLRQ